MNTIEDIFSLKGKCAVVIGGKGKIGTPMTKALATAGATVYVCSRSSSQEEISKTFDNNPKIQGRQLDQSDENQVNLLLDELNQLGHSPSILINCGVDRPMKKHIKDSWQNWDKSMISNSRGLFVTCRAFARSMAEKGGGSIVNVASIYGIVAPDPQIYEGTDMFTEPDYPFHKGGMIMFTKYLSSLYAKSNVRVNCIAPGGVFNNQPEPFYTRYLSKVPMQRMANGNDFYGITVFLASDSSSYITGTVIPIDGGCTIKI